MRVAELVGRYERQRAEAARVGASAPLVKVYSAILEDLRALDGESEPGRRLTTSEAAQLLSLSTKTVRRWIRSGRLPATRTSEGGEWRILAEAVYREAGRTPSSPSSVPHLWSPDEDG